MAETNEKASALIATSDGGSNAEYPNFVSGMIMEKAENHDHKFRFRLKDENINHLSSWDQEGGRVLVWHYIVNGILISRHLSPSLDAWSPYYFMEDKGRGSCVIGRVYQTDFDPSKENDHFNVGSEDPTEDALMHICVTRKKLEVTTGFDETNQSEKIWASTKKETARWQGEAPFLIHAEAGADQVRLSYDLRWTIQNGIPYVPIWFVYNNGIDQPPKVFLDESPVVDFPQLRQYYDLNREEINAWYEDYEPSGQKKNWERLREIPKESLAEHTKAGNIKLPPLEALKAAGILVCLRYYIGVSIPGMREGDVGHGKPGGPPPPPSGGDGF